MIKNNSRLIIAIQFCVIVYLLINLSWPQSKYSQNEENETREKVIYSKSLEKLEQVKFIEKKPQIEHIDIFDNIFKSSNEQNLIDPSVIIKTAQFMLEERNEDDPELVDFVRNLIVKASGQPINLNFKNKVDFSQLGQSSFMDKALNSKTNGFFVEAGGHDGESLSNSLYFELTRGWTGILIEPLPNLYKKILSKNRNIYVLNACIANRRPLIAKMNLADAWSGRLSEFEAENRNKVNQNYVVYVPCFSLYTILKAINISQVDYFSLDVEGGELDVLNSIDFKRLDIKSFTIEHNGVKKPYKNIKLFMSENNYTLIKEDGQDFYYVK